MRERESRQGDGDGHGRPHPRTVQVPSDRARAPDARAAVCTSTARAHQVRRDKGPFGAMPWKFIIRFRCSNCCGGGLGTLSGGVVGPKTRAPKRWKRHPHVAHRLALAGSRISAPHLWHAPRRDEEGGSVVVVVVVASGRGLLPPPVAAGGAASPGASWRSTAAARPASGAQRSASAATCSVIAAEHKNGNRRLPRQPVSASVE